MPVARNRSEARVRVALLTAASWAAFAEGNVKEGRELMRAAADLAETHQHGQGIVRARINLALRTLFSRPLVELETDVEQSLSHARRGGLDAAEVACLDVSAYLATARGDWQRADELIRTVGSREDGTFEKGYQDRVVMERHLGMGDFPAVLELESVRAAKERGLGEVPVLQALRTRAQLALGNVADASQEAQEMLEGLDAKTARDEECATSCLGAAAEVAAASMDAGLATTIRARYDLAATPRRRYIEALLHLAEGGSGVEAAIESVAHEVEGDGRLWEAACIRGITAIVMSRIETERAHAASFARDALQGFRTIDSPGWCRAMEGLLRTLGKRAPTRPSGALREGLTPREQEVLSLVAQGLSNRVIAERLVISEGTAIRHVANIFAKLRVHTRAEAARIAAEKGIVGSPGGGT
jgi:DNA-binding NarL/FixJ family response regulator